MYGKNVKTVAYTAFSEEEELPNGQQTVTYEARKIKCLLLKLQNYWKPADIQTIEVAVVVLDF